MRGESQSDLHSFPRDTTALFPLAPSWFQISILKFLSCSQGWRHHGSHGKHGDIFLFFLPSGDTLTAVGAALSPISISPVTPRGARFVGEWAWCQQKQRIIILSPAARETTGKGGVPREDWGCRCYFWKEGNAEWLNIRGEKKRENKLEKDWLFFFLTCVSLLRVSRWRQQRRKRVVFRSRDCVDVVHVTSASETFDRKRNTKTWASFLAVINLYTKRMS